MRRYAALVRSAYTEGQLPTTYIAPKQLFPNALMNRRFGKWLIYIEKYVLFAPRLCLISGLYQTIHVVDHSDGIYLNVVSQKQRVILTCHDLFAIRAARGEILEHNTRATGRLYQRLILRGIGRASEIVSVSTSTADDVRRLTGRGTSVIANPIDPIFTTNCTPRNKLPSYLLCVSPPGWRKRRESAIEAWLALRQTPSLRGVRLVIVGPDLTTGELTLVPPELRGEVDTAASVTDRDLVHLYQNCEAALVLSRFEGFGWPILEAQATGKACLVTDSDHFRSIAGDGAAYVDPESLASLDAESLERVAADLISTELRQLALTNAKAFAWDAFVDSLGSLHRFASSRTETSEGSAKR